MNKLVNNKIVKNKLVKNKLRLVNKVKIMNNIKKCLMNKLKNIQKKKLYVVVVVYIEYNNIEVIKIV